MTFSSLPRVRRHKARQKYNIYAVEEAWARSNITTPVLVPPHLSDAKSIFSLASSRYLNYVPVEVVLAADPTAVLRVSS